MKKTRSKKSRDTVPLKGQCHNIFDFKIFSKIFGYIRSSRFTTGVMKKVLYIYKFRLQVQGICSLILFLLVATSVVDTCGKFEASNVATVGNLPPVLFTPAANFRQYS
jgi:hypothetical protein